MVAMLVAAGLIALLVTSATPTGPGRAVRRTAGRATVAGAKQAARPVRYAGRRTRSAGIGWWGRAVVAAYDRADVATGAGDHRAARRWRLAGDVLLGEAPLRCHVKGCPQMWARPTLYEVVDHLREHRRREREQPAEPEPTTVPEPVGTTPEPPAPEAPAPSSCRSPKVGDRHTDSIGRVMEWVGDAWTPVCSRDDIPMDDYSRDSWLRCKQCGTRAVDDRPERTTGSETPLAVVIPLHNHQEETVNATPETTSLARAKDFATSMAAANEGMIPQLELSKAHMAAREVSGRPLEICDELTEIYRTAAAKAAELHAELSKQDQVQEAYRANADAGDKQFQMAE